MFFRKRPPRANLQSLAVEAARLRISKPKTVQLPKFQKQTPIRHQILLASSSKNDSFGTKVEKRLVESGHEVDVIVPNTSHLFDKITPQKKYDIVMYLMIYNYVSLLSNAVHPMAYEFDPLITHPLASSKGRDKLFKSFLEVLGTIKPKAYIQHSSTITRRTATDHSIFERDRLAIESSKKLGCEILLLRFGILYSATNQLTQALVSGLLNRKICIAGDGSNSVSVIHEHDAVRALESACELAYNQSIQTEKDKQANKPRTLPNYLKDVELFRNQVEGKLLYGYDIVDNTVLTQAELLLTLARTFEAPRDPPFGRGFVANFLMNRYMVDFLESEMRGCNLEFQEVSDWRPRYKSLEEGLLQVEQEWKESGWLEAARKQTQQQPEPRGLLDRLVTRWKGTKPQDNATPAS